MRVVGGKHTGQSQEGLVAYREMPENYSLMILDHTAFHVRSSGKDKTGIDRTSGKRLSMGRHEKASFRLACIRLTALHGAPRTHGCV